MKRITMLACAALVCACSSSETVVRTDSTEQSAPPPVRVAESRTQSAAPVEPVAVTPLAPAMPLAEPAPLEESAGEPVLDVAEEMVVGTVEPEPSAVPTTRSPVDLAALTRVRAAMLAAIREDRLDRAAGMHAELAGRMDFAADDPRAELAADVDALAGFVAAMQQRGASASRD